MNKELVLREFLALERTKMVNESTLLSYIRTGLYFLVAGSTLGEVVQTFFWTITGPLLIVVGLIIVVIGFIRYFITRRVIEMSRQNIGESSDAFVKAARGDYAG